MRVSRTPERRGGNNKSMMFVILVIAALLIGILVTYITTGLGSSSAKGAQSEVAAAETAPPTNNPALAALPSLATQVPTAVPAPEPAVEADVAEVASSPFPGFVPEVAFGEVLAEGFIDIDLPSQKGVATWYTFQVDTASREMTLFFAIYNEAQDALVRSVQVDGYTQGQILNNVEIIVFYPNSPKRILGFDGSQGIMTIAQQNGKPLGPSLFSPELRVALVDYGISLQDATGNIQTQLHLDISGLSETEGIVLSRYSPDLVSSVLKEVQLLVDQVESLRAK